MPWTLEQAEINLFCVVMFQFSEDEPSPLLQIPDWQLASESSEDGESVFPWLPSHPQAVLQISDGSEDFQLDHSEEEEEEDDDERSLSPPLLPVSIKKAPVVEANPSTLASNPHTVSVIPTTPAVNGVPKSRAEKRAEREKRRAEKRAESVKSEGAKSESEGEEKAGSEKPKKRIHTCGVCKKSYRLAASLEKHLKVPCELRPYKCEDCGKAFKRPDHLKAHSRMHTGERPFLCNLCGKTFRQKNHLQRHAERKHIHPKPGDDDDNNSSFDATCGLEDLEDDEMRSEDQD
jgi:uncharacterized Zn-finger protein